jgi:hypothetical protein
MPPREDLFADAERAGVDRGLVINNATCSVRHEFDRKRTVSADVYSHITNMDRCALGAATSCQKNFLFSHAGWFLLTPHA